MFIANYAEAARHGMESFSWKVELISRPWGFRLEETRVPVSLWHGGHDTSIPPGRSSLSFDPLRAALRTRKENGPESSVK